jgi:hypothetical protein
MEVNFINFVFSFTNKTKDILIFSNFGTDGHKVDYEINKNEIKKDEEFVIKFKIRTNKELIGELFFNKTSFLINNYLQSNSLKSDFGLYEYESKYILMENNRRKYQPISLLLQVSEVNFTLIDK